MCKILLWSVEYIANFGQILNSVEIPLVGLAHVADKYDLKGCGVELLIYSSGFLSIISLLNSNIEPMWAVKSHYTITIQSIPLSRAPLTRRNQLVAVAHWTPNFPDSSLVAAHMTELMTHMCWSEQISPLVHSLQATWQPCNLSHCIAMHNTHLLGHVG